MNQIGIFKLCVGEKEYDIKCSIALAQNIESVLNNTRHESTRKNLHAYFIDFIENGMIDQDALKITEALLKFKKVPLNNFEIRRAGIQELKDQLIFLIGVCLGGEEFGKKMIQIVKELPILRNCYEKTRRAMIDSSGFGSKHLH